MTKSDIEQIRIEVTQAGKDIFELLLHKDGTINRKGSGSDTMGDNTVMALGMSDGSAFRTLIESLDENLVKEIGLFGNDFPDKAGQPVEYKIIFMGVKPNITVFEFKLGTESKELNSLFIYFDQFVSKAMQLTDEWYSKGLHK